MNRKQQLVCFLLNAYCCLYGAQDTNDVTADQYYEQVSARLETLPLAELEASYKVTRETLGY